MFLMWSPPGLLNGFSEEFKSRLVTVDKTVAYFGNEKMGYVNDVFDDKVFLLSNAEVGLSGETGIHDGKAYEYFIDEGFGSNRIARVSDYCFEHTNRKYGLFKAGRPWYWWLRTPYTEVPYMSNCIGQNGYLGRDMVYKGNGLRFALVISKK